MSKSLSNHWLTKSILIKRFIVKSRTLFGKSMELKIKLTSRKRTKIKTRKNNKKIIMNTSKKSGQVIDNKYILYHTLGEGTYGVVYYATDMDGNQKYAIKKIKIEENDEGIPSTTLREISVLKSLDHPNIIKLIEVIYNSV